MKFFDEFRFDCQIVAISVLESRPEEIFMSITVEAIYEAGVLKPLAPLPNLKEHDRVLVTVETKSIVDQLRGRVNIDPSVAQEIISSVDDSVLDS
jgi:predicted DNA-binding antitoxin AbrB/MazE fold protein